MTCRPRDPRAYGGDGRREDNPHGIMANRVCPHFGPWL